MSTHTEAVRALWLLKCLKYTAEELEMSVEDTAALLNEHGLIEWVLNGYRVFHTQGYEYMAELLCNTLNDKLELDEHGFVSRDV